MPVWHPGLTKKLSKDIERVQKRCLKLMYPTFTYTEALNQSGLDRLDHRLDLIAKTIFGEIKDTKHPLHYLLLPVKVSHSKMVLHPTYPYQFPNISVISMI